MNKSGIKTIKEAADKNPTVCACLSACAKKKVQDPEVVTPHLTGFLTWARLGRGAGGRRWTSGGLPGTWGRRVPHRQWRTGPSLAIGCGRCCPRVGRTQQSRSAREGERTERGFLVTLVCFFFYHFLRLVAPLHLSLWIQGRQTQIDSWSKCKTPMRFRLRKFSSG